MQSSQVDSLLSDEVHVNGETATELLKKANDQHPLSGQSLPEPQATNPANAEGKEDVKEDDDASSTTSDDNAVPTKNMEIDQRIEAALRRKVTSPDFNADDLVAGEHATFYVGTSKPYVLPWVLCSTLERIEAFVRDVFVDDEKMLSAIEAKRYEVTCFKGTEYKGVVLRDVWDKVVSPGLAFMFNEVQGGRGAPEEEQVTRYQRKIKYSVSYYQRSTHGAMNFLWATSFDHPTEFVVDADRRGELPVIEEKKRLDCSLSSRPQKPRTGGKDKLRRQHEDRVSSKVLQVHSQLLLNVLRSVIQYATGNDDYQNGVFLYPYKDLFRHWDSIASYKTDAHGTRSQHSDAYNAECDKHIDILLQYLQAQPMLRIPEHMMAWKRAKPMSTFAGLWLLLKPCEDVYVQEDGKLNAFVVDKVQGGTDYAIEIGDSTTVKTYRVRVWNLVFDGKVIYRRSRWIILPYFDGEREITSLPLFPTKFHDDANNGATRKRLIERGQRYFGYCKKPTFLEYTGPGLKEGWKSYKRSRVVIDHSSRPWTDDALKDIEDWDLTRSDLENNLGEEIRVPQCDCIECSHSRFQSEVHQVTMFSDYDDIKPKEKKELSEHQYMLLASHMFAFILKDRDYDIVEVDGLVEPLIVVDAINRLVMDPTNKSIIKAIAKTYTDTEAGSLFSADFIHGKGEGQILLLHGPPGTGKTLTAESVAEFTSRPLLSLTAADLGDEPDDLEKHLMQFFKYANDWDAVVLIDEADVYLEARSIENLKRNSVVSVFLRALDYFQGILFLTTNRVGHFDEAFMSRIHVSIGYDRLDDSARAQIWDNLFLKLREDFKKRGGPQIEYEYDAKQYVKQSSEVKRLRWNGREIRNAFQTAVALAVNDTKEANESRPKDADPVIPEIKEKHLAQVVKLSSAFKDYMKATRHNKDESEHAYLHGNRDDTVNTPKRNASEGGTIKRRTE